jgi:hypothetical protein
MRLPRLALLTLRLLVAAAPMAPGARAGTTSATLSVTIQAPLVITLNPPAPALACNAVPGTIVTTLGVTGGDGNPVTYTIGGDTADFALSLPNIVVAPGGITPAGCPVLPALTKIDSVSITATQP